ncbi:hypothetical protein SO802_031369 [Lithocarpus litseifolius]|uniref:Uncharacterized protein n=1 Tax=Lithocarpus litseifolius TaxID=425828 RepID=A0AAW2BM11_9ROSI
MQTPLLITVVEVEVVVVVVEVEGVVVVVEVEVVVAVAVVGEAEGWWLCLGFVVVDYYTVFPVPPPCYATAKAYPGGGYASTQEAKLLMINPMELRSKRGNHSFCLFVVLLRVVGA